MPGSGPSTRSLFASLAGYGRDWIRGDLAAGLAIAAVGLPTAIAYPAIAGLPPETGLYAAIAPLVAYAVFGPSRQLIVGPDAATVTVVAAVLTTVPGLADADRASVAAMLALIVGGLYLGRRDARGGPHRSRCSRLAALPSSTPRSATSSTGRACWPRSGLT